MTIDNFVGSLVEMAKAYEQMPQLRAELAETQTYCSQLAETIQQREEAILRYKTEIESLQSTIRSLEVERDDAQFQALEADDRTQRALDFIKATFGNAGTLIQALEPPKAQPATPDVSVQAVPEAAATAEPEVKGEPTIAPSTEQSAEIMADYGSRHPAPEVAPMQASPFVTSSTQEDASSRSLSATSDGAETMASASTPHSEPAPSSAPPIDRGKYYGLTYSGAKNHFGSAFTWPSRDEWLDNGGTLDNFYA